MNRIVALIIIAVVLSSVPSSLPGAGTQLPSPALVQALVDEVSGESAFNYTARISAFDRVQASDGWHEAAAWIKGELDRLGYQDAAIEGWPSNGSTRYFTYKTPIGWRAKSAELWMTSPRRERLCSFQEMPLTLIKHSSPAHVNADLVDVGTGVGEDAYRGKDVKGKIVLATGSPGAVLRDGVIRRGAAGMIGWYTEDVRPGYPNMVRYTAIWPTWEERSKFGFGFNVSKLQGFLLKKLLDEGTRVSLRADVETEFHQTQVEALSVSMPGTEAPQKELLIVGHLCHPTPSANDNGSGSGGMLEMARALKRMVDTGAIAPPRRTIRFLWVPEFAGTVPYIKAHLDRTRNTLAVINCDMIGENLAKTGGMFNITQTPESLPTYLNDVAVHFAEVVEHLDLRSLNGSANPFAWRARPYSGGSDHLLFNDGSLRVPALMFGHGDTFHHTSLDTMDKVDASELRRVSVTALGTMIYLASAGDSESRDMARLVARNGLGRLSATYHDSLAVLDAADSAARVQAAGGLVLDAVSHALWRESQAVASTLAFTTSPDVAARIKAMTEPLNLLAGRFTAAGTFVYNDAAKAFNLKPGPPAMTEADRAMSLVVPVRAPDFICPLDESYLDEKLGPGSLRDVKLAGNAPYEALNFVDGTRSVLDIARSVSVELGPVSPSDVHTYFQVLEKAGLLTLRHPSRVEFP
jgi:aminopeptidase-like protein